MFRDPFSLEFLEWLKHISIAPDECMVSFDVVLLFTSVSLGLARETIIHILADYDLGLPPAAMIDLLDYCLSNYFQFDSRFYQQLQGTPMGSPISGLIAEAVLQRFERVAFAVISPKFWKLYVDDTFVIIEQDNFSAFHQLLNTTLPGISFTMETATENKLPILDVLVHKLPSGTFETSVYRKATNADIVLHYSPASHKRYLAESQLTAAMLRRATRKGATSTDFSTAMATRLISSGVPYVTGTVNPLLLPTARLSSQHGEPYLMSKTYPN